MNKIMVLSHSENPSPVLVVSVFLWLATFFFLSFGWIWLMKKAKKPILAFSRFLVAATLVSVLINLNLPTAQPEGTVRLIEVHPQYNPNFISIYFYLFFSAVLVILYSTKAGRTKWGARSTGILVFANILLFFYY